MSRLRLVYDYAWYDGFRLLFVLNVDIFGRVFRALKSLTKLHFKRFHILVKNSLVKFFCVEIQRYTMKKEAVFTSKNFIKIQ